MTRLLCDQQALVRRRRGPQKGLGWPPSADSRTLRSELFIYPDIREVLAKEVAWGDVPALELGGGRDDAIPPQQRHRVGLRQCMSLKVMHHLRSLPRVGGHCLGDIERVEKTIT